MSDDEIIKHLKAFARANAKYLEREGVRLSKEDQEVLQAYRQKFGGLPADGGFTIEAAKECLKTGKDFYDRFPKGVNP